MKISVAWLRELVDAKLDADEVARRLTLAGLEIEGRERFGAFSGVVKLTGRFPNRQHPLGVGRVSIR